MNCQAQEHVLYFRTMTSATLVICSEGGKDSGPALVGSVQGQAS